MRWAGLYILVHRGEPIDDFLAADPFKVTSRAECLFGRAWESLKDDGYKVEFVEIWQQKWPK